MLIVEYRVILPMTVAEYQVAQLYSVAQASKNETGGGEGIEVQKNEPYTDYPLLGGKYNAGQYTYKIYHLESKVGKLIKGIAPKGSLKIEEEAWNAYPYCKTVITNKEYMKEGFHICIETLHAEGDGSIENGHELNGKKLSERKVVYIDIANDNVKPADYKPEWDPTKVRSEKAGRGPLEKTWRQHTQPMMCAYKLVTCEFKWFGLQTMVENFIIKAGYHGLGPIKGDRTAVMRRGCIDCEGVEEAERRIFTNFHRQVFCWMDEWYGLTMEDIRAIEDKTKDELDQQRASGAVRGMKGSSDP